MISEKILFETGRSTISVWSYGILQAVAAVLADYPKIEVRVEEPHRLSGRGQQ